MITARIRWVPPVILCLAILIYALIPQPQAPFDSMQEGYTLISWLEFITGPLAILMMASSFAGFLYCYFQNNPGFGTMGIWLLISSFAMTSGTVLKSLLVC